jgi:hypothetical protein
MIQKIVLQQELKAAVYECRAALYKAQEALQSLTKLADYPTPSGLEDVTVANLVAFVQQRVVAVKNTPLYTQAQREIYIDEWVEWRVKAMPHVVAVERFVSDWREVAPKLDGGSIVTDDITESLTPRYTVQVPLQAHTHLQLINSVREAINSLREWEKQQDTKKIPLQNLLNIKEDDLLQSWCNGSIMIDHTQDNAGAKLWREAINANML